MVFFRLFWYKWIRRGGPMFARGVFIGVIAGVSYLTNLRFEAI